MSIDFKLSGFDEFEKTLVDMIEVKYPEEVKKILYELAEELREKAKEKTPVGTRKYFYSGGRKRKIRKSSRLRNSWKVGRVRQKNGEFFIEMYNNAPHAHLIEDGHRIVGKDGSDHGWYHGKHMLLVSTKQLEERLEPRLQAWLNEMLEELSL
jgi:hypothetical protein